MAPQFFTIKQRLLNDSIHAPDDWIENCLEWINQNEGGRLIPQDELYKMVYGQWLDSDLSILAVPTMPDNLNQESCRLTGNFCLQVNSVVDVSRPFFQQLVKLKGLENENVNVTDQIKSNDESSKSSRMLHLQVTDGCHVITAVEYKPIPCLSTDLPPGTKIRIKGSMECRRNILFLKAPNVELLGGAVEDLATNNDSRRILTNALGPELDEEALRWWIKKPGPLTPSLNGNSRATSAAATIRATSASATIPPASATIPPASATIPPEKSPKKFQQVSMTSYLKPRNQSNEPAPVVDDDDDQADELLAIALAMEEDF